LLPVSEGQETIPKNVSADIPFLYLKPSKIQTIFCCFENEITIICLITVVYIWKISKPKTSDNSVRSDFYIAIILIS